MNRIPFRPWAVEHKAVSSILRYARPCFHRLFRPSRLAPTRSVASRLTRSIPLPLHVHEPWPYVCVSRRSRPCPYVCMSPYFLSCTLDVVRTCTCYVRASTTTRACLYYDTCEPILRHVPFLTRPRFIAATCRQTDRPVCTYTFATRMTTLRTLRLGGSRLSGTSLPAKM